MDEETENIVTGVETYSKQEKGKPDMTLVHSKRSKSRPKQIHSELKVIREEAYF